MPKSKKTAAPSLSWWTRVAQHVSSFFVAVWRGISNFFSFSSSIRKEQPTVILIETKELFSNAMLPFIENNDQPSNDKKKPALTRTLPERDITHIVARYLRATDQSAMTCTSKTNQGLFFQPERLTAKLLLYIARGEQDKAEQILIGTREPSGRQIMNGRPDLLFKRGDVTDYSGRTFKNITAFQYALWAMDTHMCRMIIHAIPEDAEGEALRAELINQYEELEVHGVTYELEGQTYTNQHHFNFSRLIEALQSYVDSFDGWGNELLPYEAQIDLWCQVVGLEQRYVPAHVAQEYCHPTRSFNPTPTFNDPTLERSLSIFNYSNGRMMEWFDTSPSLVLGKNFGIVRTGTPDFIEAAGWVGVSYPGARCRKTVAKDVAAIMALCKVRSSDLRQTLESLRRGNDHDSRYVIS